MAIKLRWEMKENIYNRGRLKIACFIKFSVKERVAHLFQNHPLAYIII